MQGGRHAELRVLRIAPRQEVGPSSPQPGYVPSGNPPREDRRNRIPPRSKSGCRKCRTRKVKCDEGRPTCGQCERFDHICDYNAKVIFKDDTPKVLERTQQVITIGSHVWDPKAQDQKPKVQVLKDMLPPFSTLTTDDEREEKAQSRDPGTFVVVANLTSFADLPEYQGEILHQGTTNSEYEGVNIDPTSLVGGIIDEVNDPNVVVLKTFEDPFQKAPAPLPYRPRAAIVPRLTSPTSSCRQTSETSFNSSTVSLLDAAHQGRKDAELLHYYRTTISPQIIKIGKSQVGEDMFEAQAREYPPLFHAMMALSALSIAQKKASHNTNAFEHYQQVIPALQTAVQSTENSYSDGTLLTHLLLLFYEIVAQETTMWQYHCDQLLRIVSMRRQACGADHFDFVIWMIFCIDVYALLSASGTGMFAEVVSKQNMLPLPERCLLPETDGHPQVIFPEEQAHFPRIIAVTQEIFLLALQVGRLAKVLRTEVNQKSSEGFAHVLDDTHNIERSTRIRNLRQLIFDRNTEWRSLFPGYQTWLQTPNNLPPRVLEWVEHSYLLFRVCILYTHTSMYSGQLHDPEPDTDAQIKACCAEILHAISIILTKQRCDLQYIVFPLFLAGFCTRNVTEKDTALELMAEVEKREYGGVADTLRRLLQTIYEKQSVAVAQTGDASSVDWVDEMERNGPRLIIYGL